MGTKCVLSILPERYWIMSAQHQIKSVLQHCPTCQLKFRTIMKQYMADPPPERITFGQKPVNTVG